MTRPVRLLRRILPMSAVLTTFLSATFHSHPVVAAAGPSKLPEASSTLLQTHRRHYLQHPPHDTHLYDVLQVSPNATAADIQKSYRRLVRQLHPDKQQPSGSTEEEDKEQGQLHRVQQAYQVLNDDSSRLPYHKYGLVGNTAAQAVHILTGRVDRVTDANQIQLLQLMGYYPHDDNTKETTRPQERHQRRVYYIAAGLVERLRPLVEERVPEAVVVQEWIRTSDQWKRLPMGAQVLRCIGRAYRFSGQQALLRYSKRRTSSVKKKRKRGSLLGETWREAKHLLTAALASGRVVVEEHRFQRNRPKQQRSAQRIGYHWDDRGFGAIDMDATEDDDSDFAPPTDEEIKELEYHKAQAAVLESLQIEALWKITKIDLDRTIREACNLILDGDYFFFSTRHHDGWVGSANTTIDKETGQRRAAEALILLGNIMVQRSKEGTAWME